MTRKNEKAKRTPRSAPTVAPARDTIAEPSNKPTKSKQMFAHPVEAQLREPHHPLGQPRYRHEFKYIISNQMMAEIENQIKYVLPLDPHVGAEGKYLIRSVYFDDYQNNCYYDNENGVDPREKYRIRIYNCRDNRIKLECKRKDREKTQKKSCLLTREEAFLLMSGQPIGRTQEMPPILNKFLLEMTQRIMRPATIVQYQRTPYIYPVGNVRVTFDTNIVASKDYGHFFDKQIIHRPIMPTGFQLMEVKYDEFLPDFIYNCLHIDGLERTAFSKYYLSRKYNL